jgi:hypothetical protein
MIQVIIGDRRILKHQILSDQKDDRSENSSINFYLIAFPSPRLLCHAIHRMP